MQLMTFADAGAFLTATQATLEQHETANSLILGVVQRMRDLPEYVESPPFLAAVQDGDRLVAAAMMTPPHRLVLTSNQNDYPAALALIAEQLLTPAWSVPGVNGPTPVSTAFAQLWTAHTGQPATIQHALRVFELQAVLPPPQPPGQLRLATAADEELLATWLRAFNAEALGEPATDESTIHKMVERGIKYNNYFVWDNHGPVALAGRARPTRRGVTIGPVYTPPEQRNRGYATALVAALSQRLLDEGKLFVTLFTDLANPTSNSIYQKIGFRPVVDFTEYGFG